MMDAKDDQKEDLQWETVWATIGMAGGPLVWVGIIGSFFGMQFFRKYTDHAQKDVHFGNSTMSADGTEIAAFDPWDYFVHMMMLNQGITFLDRSRWAF